jgi:hypothetical protein
VTASIACAGTVTATAARLAGSLTSILTDADPAQVLIDTMGFGTLPTYMWGGNEASGANELISGTYDLTDTSISKQQTPVYLDGDVSDFNQVTDKMANTSLPQVGTGSFAGVVVFGLTIASAGPLNTLIGDRDASSPNLGWVTGHTSTAWQLLLDFGASTTTVQVTGLTVSADGLVLVFKRDATAATANIYSDQGNASASSVPATTLSNTVAPSFSLCKCSAANGQRMEFGIAALWYGSGAESIAETHRDTLASRLGLS